MGMNVTGVNSYSQKALPTTAPNYTSQVQASLLSQPAYDTFSLSGNYQTQQKEKEGMSTAAKVGIVATVAAVALGIWAASRGKKVNNELGKEAAGLVDNIGAGLKSIFTKAGRESYKEIAQNSDKLDDGLRVIANASDDAVKAANEKYRGLQQEAKDLSKQIKEKTGILNGMSAENQASDTGKKLAEEIKGLQDKYDDIVKAGTDAAGNKTPSKLRQARRDLRQLSGSNAVRGDKNFEQLQKAQAEATTRLNQLQEAKKALQTEQTELAKKMNEIRKIQNEGGILSEEQKELLKTGKETFDKIGKKLEQYAATTGEQSIQAAEEAQKLATDHATRYMLKAGQSNLAQVQYNADKAAYEALQKTLDGTAINLRSADDVEKLEKLKKAMESSEGKLKEQTGIWETFMKEVTGWFTK